MIRRIFPALFVLLLLFGTLIPLAFAQQGKLPFRVPKNPMSLPPSALIETTQGPIEIQFYRAEAPVTVANFVHLAKKGFYTNLPFHRYIKDFVVQGGDPTGTGEGGTGYLLPPEYSQELKHQRGTVGMARKPAAVNPERQSNGSQFYIILRTQPSVHLDGLYTVFAKVIRGIENAERLRPGDKIKRVRVAKAS